MKWMRFCDSRNSKDTNVIPICYNGLVHKTDSNISCNQCLDGNKTADRDTSVKIIQRITGSRQSLRKNFSGAGSILSDNNRLL